MILVQEILISLFAALTAAAVVIPIAFMLYAWGCSCNERKKMTLEDRSIVDEFQKRDWL